MIESIFCVLCAFMNRARGTKLFEMTRSTTIGRIVSMGGIAFVAHLYALMHGYSLFISVGVFAWVWASLMLWCVWGWDDLWSATIGDQPDKSRLWGLAHLALRMIWGVPCIVGLALLAGHPFAAIWALGVPLLALPYYVWGFVPHQYTINNAEMTVGAMWWLMISGVLS